jgi:2,4'-dihydroxyacetophenone dioxygenase
MTTDLLDSPARNESRILCPQDVAATTLRYSRPDVHIASDDTASPKIEVFPGIFVRFLSFDVRSNSFSNITMVPDGGIIGRHRHRGSVVAITLEGTWRYLEYDWVAGPGSFDSRKSGSHSHIVSRARHENLFCDQRYSRVFR